MPVAGFRFLLCLSLALALCALFVPSAARAEFLRHTSSSALVHWAGGSIRMPVDPELERRYGPEIYDALAAAADQWAFDPSVPRIELAVGGTPEERDAALAESGNWIGIRDDWPYGDQLAVTVSTMGTNTGRMVATQVWIHPAFAFALGDAEAIGDAFDLQGVLVHELGHVLGLGEADGHPGMTMFPSFNRGETHQRTLARGDENAVLELYASTAHDAPRAQSCALTAPRLLAKAGPLDPRLFVLLIGGVTLARRTLARRQRG